VPKVEQVVRSALAAVETDAHVDIGILWCNERIQEAAAYGKFRFLRLTRSVLWPATVSQGTVSATRGETKVIPDVVAAAAWSPSFARKRVIQMGNSAIWYPIDQVTSDHLTLQSPFSEPSVTVTSYKIVQQVMALPDYRRVDIVTLPRLRRAPLEIITRERLESLAPTRLFNAGGMRYVAPAGESEEGQLQIETYPYSSNPETILVTGYRIPKQLTNEDYLPGAIDQGILKDGILVDIYRYEHAKALRAGQGQVAMLWQQQLVAQEARWREARKLLALQDREIDDSSIQVRIGGGYPAMVNSEIITAYDEIYSRGRRP
jgi:hypothetical protein